MSFAKISDRYWFWHGSGGRLVSCVSTTHDIWTQPNQTP